MSINPLFSAKSNANKIPFTTANECNIPDDVKNCYENICAFFERVGTTPSICTINNELLVLYKDNPGNLYKLLEIAIY